MFAPKLANIWNLPFIKKNSWLGWKRQFKSTTDEFDNIFTNAPNFFLKSRKDDDLDTKEDMLDEIKDFLIEKVKIKAY